MATKVSKATADRAEASSLADRIECPECRAIYIRLASGILLCPNGHGRSIGPARLSIYKQAVSILEGYRKLRADEKGVGE